MSSNIPREMREEKQNLTSTLWLLTVKHLLFGKEIFLILAELLTLHTKSQMNFPKAEYQVAKMENGFGWFLMMDGKKPEK